MPDLNLLKAELAIYGIRVGENGQCEVIRASKHIPTTIHEEISALTEASKANKQFLRELLRELCEILSAIPIASVPGNELTQRLFSSAILALHSFVYQFKTLNRESTLLDKILKKDINLFSESYMSKVVQYRISIDWMDYLIRIDEYKTRLLKMVGVAPVTAQIGGPWTGGIYLTDAERVIDGTGRDDEEDNIRDGRKLMAPYDKENELPETYNDPDKFEAGFYYREIRNEPYAFDDEDNNPYPHRNLLWQ